MSMCPACRHELTIEETQSGVCPACQARLSSPHARTIAEADFLSLDAEPSAAPPAMPKPDPKSTATVAGGFLPPDDQPTFSAPPPLPKKPPVNSAQTVAGDFIDVGPASTSPPAGLPPKATAAPTATVTGEFLPTKSPADFSAASPPLKKSPAGSAATVAGGFVDLQAAVPELPLPSPSNANSARTVAGEFIPPLDAGSPATDKTIAGEFLPLEEPDPSAQRNIGRTLDASAFPPMTGGGKTESKGFELQPGIECDVPSQSPSGSSPAGGRDIGRTISERDLPPPPGGAPPKTGTIYDRGIGATMDFSQLPGGRLPPGSGTIVDRGAGGAIHFNQLTGGKLPGGGAALPPRGGQQPDFGDISPEEAGRVTRMFQDAGDPGANPRMTMKGSVHGGGKKSTLVVQPRSLRALDKGASDVDVHKLDYELLEVLGEGGMGVVYSARQASIDRTVAIKMVKAHVAEDQEQRSKFLSEAVVTGELEHPNIVPIYDLGANEAGALFYSMKKVQGTPWMKVVERKSLAENLEILMKVADAVAFAHSRGVVHRDLKPENVMLGEYGEVLVMDWGLAMSMPGFRKAQNINQSVGMGGTPAYMAPEMATGPFERIGPASDVYLLGAILFEIITGAPPHDGRTTMHCLMAAGRNEIIASQKSGELMNIAIKAMATEPEDRYPGVIAFQNALREYQSHSESIALSTRAEEELAEAQKTNEYPTFARSVFGFEEALSLWQGNDRARYQLTQARLAYAGSALGKGDYDLGLSLLDANELSHADLRRQITLAQAEREARQQRLKNVKRLVAGLVAAILVIVTGAFAITLQQRNRAVAAEREAQNQREVALVERDKAITAEAEAQTQKELAVQQRDRAVKAEEETREQRDIAESKRKEAEQAKMLAEEQRKKAVDAKELAETQRKKAEMARREAEMAKEKEAEQRVLAEKAKTEAEEAREKEETARLAAEEAKEKEAEARVAAEEATEAALLAKEKEATQRRLAVKAKEQESRARQAADIARLAAEEAKLAEEYEAYIARIGLAAAKIDENAFDHAEQLLGECQPLQLRNWEWGRLKHLCGQSKRSFAADGPVDAVAYSPDGRRFIAGSWDGRARIWSIENDAPPLEIPYGGEYVQAVAFSPNGKLVATGGNDRRGFVRLWNAETGQPVQTFSGHEDSVLSVLFSKDGSKLLTSSYDKTARLWDVESGRELRVFRGHHWWVWSAIFSPDERQVVTASQDGTARVWSLEGEATKSQPMFTGHSGPVYALSFSPDGRHVASAGYDNRVLIWDVNDVKPFDFKQLVSEGKVEPPQYRALTGHTAAVRSVRFSKDGKLLLSAGQDNTVKVWDAASGKTLKTLRGHAGWVRSCAFSPDGHWVLSGSHDHTAKLWSIDGYEEVRVLQGRVLEGHTDGLLAAQFSPDGQRIVTASRDRTARLWDVASARELQTFSEGHEFLASNAAFFADGQRLVTAAVDSTARVWDVSTGTESMRLDHTGRNAALALSRDGRRIITGGDDRTAQVWDAATGERLFKLDGHPGEITAASCSPDGQSIVTGDDSGHCRLWQAADGKLLHRLEGHTRRVVAVAFTGDGKRIVTASADHTVAQWDPATGEERRDLVLKHKAGVRAMVVSPRGPLAVTSCDDGVVRVWNLDTAASVGVLKDAGGDVTGLAMSADGRRVLTIGAVSGTGQSGKAAASGSPGRGVRIWDLAKRSEITSGAGGKDSDKPFLESRPGLVIWTALFTPDGESVLTVGGDGARLWSIDSRRERINFSPHGAVAGASFSPDGQRVVTGSWDNSAKIWNVNTGRAELKLAGGHKSYVNSAVFSRDGQQVLTASDDKTVLLWNLADVSIDRAFTGHEDRVRSAVFSPDGTRILTASNDRTARVWDASTGENLLTLNGHDWAVLCAAYSADGRFIITGSEDNKALIWDAVSGRRLMSLEGHTAPVTSVAFSPDGARALTGSRDNSCKLWDSAPVVAPRRVQLNDSPPVDPMEPSDAEQAAADEMPAEDAVDDTATDDLQASDSAAPVENSDTQDVADDKPDADHPADELLRGKEILTLAGHTQEVTSVSFSPDGRFVLTGSRDNTAFIWLTSGWQSDDAVPPARTAKR